MSREGHETAHSMLRWAPVLKACRPAPQRRRALVEATGTSRTTIYRMTVALEAEGLLEETDEGYRTTPRGNATSALVERYLDGVEALEDLSRLFELVDHPELVEHAHLLADVRVTVADAADPYRVVDRVVERFEATDRSRGTITNPTSVQALDRVIPLLDKKESIERIFQADAFETHESYGGQAFEEVLNYESVTLLVTEDPLPFTFAIDEDSISIVGHDPATGLPTIHVESDHDQAREWLETLYNRYRDRAQPISRD